jgi:hypothetical protein
MIKKPSEKVQVEIRDNRTRKVIKSLFFKAPEPGMVTIWDLRTSFSSNDLSIRIDWPMKEEPLVIAGKDFIQGWKHFLSKINWEQTNLDAEAVRFMNEIPGEIAAAVKEAEE